jgi:phenylacetate-CoA ligase
VGSERPGQSLLARARWSSALALRAPREGSFPFRSGDVHQRVQARRIRRTVEHAYQHVPYYRDTMRRLGLVPADFRTEADLARLPLIAREDLQREPEYFVSRAAPIESYLRLRTSGSSGKPVTVYRDYPSTFLEAASGERWRAVIMSLAGKRLRFRQAVIDSPTGNARRARAEFQRRSLVSPSLRMTELHLSMFDELAHNIERINGFRPDCVRSFGSYIETLFRYGHESAPPLRAPSVVVYRGERLSESARDLITEHFGSSVLSVYGAIEAPNIGFECERHLGHHLNLDLCPVRIVDANGNEVRDGEGGHVILSNLVNRGTVLLNYRIGDVASKLATQCPCGRSLPMLSFIEGRIADWVRAPSGRLVHPQAIVGLISREEHVWQSQVIQETPTHFHVFLVAGGACDREALRPRLAQKFVDRLGEEASIEVSFVDSLERTKGGKVPTVISRLTGSGRDQSTRG